MAAECPNLLLQFTEGAFNPEPVAVEPDDGQWVQIQAGACQDALDAIHFHQDEAQFLVQLLPPKKIYAVIAYRFLFAIEFGFRFHELFLMGGEQSFQVNGIPLFGRPAPARFSGTRLLERGTGLFGFGDDFHVYFPAVV